MTVYVNDGYILAFADDEGETYNVHITDDLNSYGTWEYIDFKFTLPESHYILIWRRDKKEFTKENASAVTKYVRKDLKEFIEEGKWNDSDWHQKIKQKLVDSNNCLVLAWDEMDLPEIYDTWGEFTKDVHEIANEKSKEIAKPGSIHDQELAIYEGKTNFNKQDNPILKSYSVRTNKYTGYKIPSDETIKKVVTELILENYNDANIILSEHYGIFPAEIETEEVGDTCEKLGIKPKKLIEIGKNDPKLVADMLQDRITAMEDAEYAPQYIKSTVTAIKSWLSHFDIVISRKLLITDPEATPTLIDERVPEKRELTELFIGANLRAGTIMSFMAKSGVRPQVLGNIEGTDGLMLEDLSDLALVNGEWCFLNQPPEVIVRKPLSKARHEYKTYMTPLGQKWFLAYLNERMANGEALTPKSPVVNPMKNSPYATKQKKGRFMTTQMVSRDVREAMRPKFKWRPYVLRAYFRTQLLIAEANGLVSHSIAEWFFGHKGDMSARYSTNKGVLPKQLVETMKESFLRCQEFLDIEKEVVIKETPNAETFDMPEPSSILYDGKIQKVQEIRESSQQMNQNNISTEDGSS